MQLNLNEITNELFLIPKPIRMKFYKIIHKKIIIKNKLASFLILWTSETSDIVLLPYH